jgi:DNA-binding phage protein
MDIGEALYRILQLYDCPVTQFAQQVGMPRSQIYKILRDDHSPTLSTVERLGKAFNMSAPEFLYMIETITDKDHHLE